MSFDPNVWTKEPLDGNGPEWYWGRDTEPDDAAPYPRAVLRVSEWRDEHLTGFHRSILPILSAEEHAALKECEKALRNVFDVDGNPPMPNTARAVALYTDAASALARLDAVRKETKP